MLKILLLSALLVPDGDLDAALAEAGRTSAINTARVCVIGYVHKIAARTIENAESVGAFSVRFCAKEIEKISDSAADRQILLKILTEAAEIEAIRCRIGEIAAPECENR